MFVAELCHCPVIKLRRRVINAVSDLCACCLVCCSCGEFTGIILRFECQELQSVMLGFGKFVLTRMHVCGSWCVLQLYESSLLGGKGELGEDGGREKKERDQD